MKIFDYSTGDHTQQIIKAICQDTLRLLCTATESDDVIIILMPDCGPSHNCGRNGDGNFTGTATLMSKSGKFIIPVWTTINYCGVCIYKLRTPITIDEFRTRVLSAMAFSPHPYTWNNFDRGNHFVSLCYSDDNGILDEGMYLVVHASANEGRSKLYPNKGVWYENEIKKISLPDKPARCLHYIEGSVAEQFYEYVEALKPFNKQRNRIFCETVLSGGIADKEILCVDHYGMPDSHTICIGAQWELDGPVPLLTAPGEDIYIVQPKTTKCKYFPHGFGLKLPNENTTIKHILTPDGETALSIGNKIFHYGDSIQIGVDAVNRITDSSVTECMNNINNVLPFENDATLSQIASFSAAGFKIHNT